MRAFLCQPPWVPLGSPIAVPKLCSRQYHRAGPTCSGSHRQRRPFPFSIAFFFGSFPQPHLHSWVLWLPSSAISMEPEAPSCQPVNGLDCVQGWMSSWCSPPSWLFAAFLRVFFIAGRGWGAWGSAFFPTAPPSPFSFFVLLISSVLGVRGFFTW